MNGETGKKLKIRILHWMEKQNRKKVERVASKLCKCTGEKEELINKLIESKSEEWKEKKIKENAIKSKAYMAILIGIILLIISIGINVILKGITIQTRKTILLSAALDVINIITSMIVGVGVSTLVLVHYSQVSRHVF